jgi:hypothetical protein
MNKEITKLEKKMGYVQGLIDAQKLKLDKYQKTLLFLAQQINEIKSKKNIK